jgi:sterol 24-C-methyltransferase
MKLLALRRIIFSSSPYHNIKSKMAPDAHFQDKYDAFLTRQLHGTSGKTEGLFAMRKDFQTHQVVLEQYFKYFGKSMLEEDKQGQEKVKSCEARMGIQLS